MTVGALLPLSRGGACHLSLRSCRAWWVQDPMSRGSEGSEAGAGEGDERHGMLGNLSWGLGCCEGGVGTGAGEVLAQGALTLSNGGGMAVEAVKSGGLECNCGSRRGGGGGWERVE